jgi:uncharacterized membrane protein YkgB
MSLVIGQCLVRIATSKFTNPESASITLFIRSSVLKSVFTLIYLNSSSNLFLIYELKKSPSSLFFETIFPTWQSLCWVWMWIVLFQLLLLIETWKSLNGFKKNQITIFQ